MERFKDSILECLLKTVVELGKSTEQNGANNLMWTNADLWIKSNDNVVIQFKMEYNDQGNVEGKIKTFKINNEGEPEPFDLRNLLGSEIRAEELTDEEAPEDYLMN